MVGDSKSTGDERDVETLVSLPDSASASTKSAPKSGRPYEPVADLDPRYEDFGVLGRGGMGEVWLCRDVRIGRKVALKAIIAGRAHRTRARARFMREARIQGQLEHPSVVPVYDLAEAADGRIFFTMKRVFGRSLDEIVRGLRDGDPQIVDEFSRRRLLEIFARVCLTVDYVHQAGVMHRDLKPANIMLGRYGEVYVLDWGLAKHFATLDDDEDRPDDPLDSAEDISRPLSTRTGDDTDARPTLASEDADEGNGTATQAGELVGTPGYMAPEQLDGGARPVGARADIYALGAVLFELLTGEPLHARSTMQGRIGSTIEGADARCHARVPDADVPPELEAICVRATAYDLEKRYPSVRALHDDVDAYLEGDRDLTQRRAMARDLAQRAARRAESLLDAPQETTLVEVLDTPEPDADRAWEDERRETLELAARALALDPDNEAARSTVVQLIVEPPRVLPPALREELKQAEWQSERTSARGGVAGFLAWLTIVPGVLFLGVRDWMVMGLLILSTAGAAAVSYYASRAEGSPQWTRPTSFALALAALFALGRVTGPLILIPSIAATVAGMYVVHPKGSSRGLYMSLAAAIVLVPLGLELLGVLPPSYAFEAGRLVVDPHLTELPERGTLAFLALTAAATIVVPAMINARARDKLRRAQRRVIVHAWQLEQLLPEAAKQLIRGHAPAR